MSDLKFNNKDKVISLYKFIEEFCKNKQNVITNDSKYPWKFDIKNIPFDEENIDIAFSDSVEEEIEEFEDNNFNYLLKVHKPEFQKCPEPDVILKEWLIDGWNYFKNEVKIKDKIKRQNSDDVSDFTEEKFEDNEQRTKKYQEWIVKRNVWKEKQEKIDITRNFFTNLYMQYVDLQKDSETLEIIVANGYLLDTNNSEIRHPILTKRLNFNFDANTNTLYLMNTNVKTELYSEIFHVIEDINLDSLTNLNSELLMHDYHPMDRNDTKDYLKAFVRQLSSDSKFIDEEDEDESIDNRLLMYFNPTLIVRKRLDGTIKAIEQIIKNIEDTDFIPSHLVDIVSGGMLEPPEEKEDSIEEVLAKAGGESVDVLLCKEANREQLEIAKRIDMYNAVLVQGPPGTGKTHTIANLVGHFLANGKSVLVTSYTKKALSVLKEKLPKNLQSLCVSVLDESSDDMENSIDGITDYMSRTTSFELKKEMDETKEKRIKIINELSDTRKKIFNILNAEYKSIVFNGEEISPSEAAMFIAKNKDKLSYINGNIKPYAPFPLTKDEVDYLYETNNKISSEEEKELNYKLPTMSELIGPDKLKLCINNIESLKQDIQDIENKTSWKVNVNKDDLYFETSFGCFYVRDLKEDKIDQLYNFINNYSEIEEWIKYVCCDGKKSGAYRKKWETLIDNINQTNDINQKIISDYFGKKIEIKDINNISKYKLPVDKLKSLLKKKKKLNKLDFLLNKDISIVYSDIKINGLEVLSSEDCEYILDYIDLIECRNITSTLWDNLLSEHGVSKFLELDKDEPESVAKKWIDTINKYLDWYDKDYKTLKELISNSNLPEQILLQINDLDKDIDQINKIFNSINNIIPEIINICKDKINIDKNEKTIEDSIELLENNSLINSSICINMKTSLLNKDYENYLSEFQKLESVYQKNEVLVRRNELLNKIEEVAPIWAGDIRNRIGIHGNVEAPKDILDAWKYKQYITILDEITKNSLDELQEKAQKLSNDYRKITEKYAEKCAWYNLLSKTECNIDMKMALKGWELTIKKIGKATGKNAPKYKAKARELMSQCQNAVPCWIMPINKAIESLKPGDNIFDVVIIDEASQSDISSLAISYMAKKMIVVGDDKQVSPMAVGMEIEKINTLEQMYIKGKIPNSHLYSSKTSLYDIASTTFQPLMLKEHFRCVPEIIGFSNMLSYDYKIKPLRDSSSSNLLPAVINYRVDGKRVGKTNLVEAKTIIAAIRACLNLEEYSGKTFGVISLLGDEQAKLIQSLMFKDIEPKDIENRRILVGNASNFQGDERDVIFLSMVDSGSGEGPLNFMGNGVEDATKKRYNVAVSRAKDQVWVVNSLDPAIDLKPGDIRKKLLDYATNPDAFLNEEVKINKKSESIFEERVAKKLVSEGYNIIQQYPVGAYRLDIVVTCENKKVVIECDGERFHSGEDKIREDMQRQTILERIGWKFIRIRGSLFFKDEEIAMNQVFEELDKMEIYPQDKIVEARDLSKVELLNKVNAEIKNFLTDDNNETTYDQEDILYALSNNSKKVISNTELKNKNIKDNPEDWGPSQFKYMVLFSENINRKDISIYYNVSYDTIKKSLQTVAENYNVDRIENCIDLFKKQFSQTKEYKDVYENYLKSQKTNILQDLLCDNEENLKEEKNISIDVKCFLMELDNNKISYIDNSNKSDIVWIKYDKDNNQKIQEIIEKYGYSHTLEKRGSIITDNEPAWRIMIK